MKQKNKIKKKRSLFHKIVNYFLFFLIGIFILLVLLFGITQTQTFRNYLKVKVVELVNSSINGKISLDKIDGTIFTSLILRNPTLYYEDEVVAKVKKAEINLSPFYILLKQIHLNEVNIEDAQLNLFTDSSGVLNFEKIFPPSPEDTTTSEFPFEILVSSLKLKNINFAYQTFDNKYNKKIYDTLNTNDLCVNNLNLTSKLFINISKNDYDVSIDEFNFILNVNKFNLKDFSGNIKVNEKKVEVKDLVLETDSSNFLFNLSLNGINIFDTSEIKNYNNTNFNFEFSSVQFYLTDLSPFVTNLPANKNKITSEIKLNGTLADFSLEKLNIHFGKSEINANGNVLNALNTDSLYFVLNFNESQINYNDISSFITNTKNPEYYKMPDLFIDTLKLAGDLNKIKTDLALRFNKGKINGNANIDMSNAQYVYNVNLLTKELDLKPILYNSLILNSDLQIKGKGTELKSLEADVVFNADNSSLNGMKINAFEINSNIKNQILDVTLDSYSDSVNLYVHSNVDFSNEENPIYNFNAILNNVNLQFLLNDSTYNSDFHFLVEGKGEGIDIDKLNADLSIKLFDSYYQKRKLDDIKLDLLVKSNEDGDKDISLKSSFLDFNLNGNFTFAELSNSISEQIEMITSEFNEKLNNYFPSESIVDEISRNIVQINKQNKNKNIEINNKDFDLQFSLNLKDFSVLSSFIPDFVLEAEGALKGNIERVDSSFHFYTDISIPFVGCQIKDQTYVLSDFLMDMELSNKTEIEQTNKLKVNSNLSIDDLYFSSEVKDVNLSLKLQNDSLQFISSADYEDQILAKLFLSSDFNSPFFKLDINKIDITYNKFQLVNNETISLSKQKNKWELKNFNLIRGNSSFVVDGYIEEKGEQDISIELKNFRGYDLSNTLLNLTPENEIDGDINLSAKINGTLENPIIKLNSNINDITYQKTNFGSLISNIDYLDKELKTDIKFVKIFQNESNVQNKKELLIINGFFPIDLAFTAVKDRIIKDKEININIIANDFNLETFGDVLPGVDNLKGILTSDIKINGTYENLKRNGNLKLSDASFLVEANNLKYEAELSLNLEEQNLFVENLILKNSDDVKEKGTIKGSGSILFDGFDVEKAELKLNGDLTVLSDKSKSTSPFVYGPLYISTDKDLIFSINRTKMFLSSSINIEDANLIFPPLPTVYAYTYRNFVYHYVEDTSKTLSGKQRATELISSAKKMSSNNTQSYSGNSLLNFDYDITVKIKDEGRITFYISKEANQKLFGILRGDVRYISNNGIENIQGEMKLLPGSYLEFIKTFTAEGSVLFESDYLNPYLNVVGTYKGFYSNPTDTVNTKKEEEVAVKIKLKGYLDEVFTNLGKEDNIAVYYGKDAIDNDQPSPEYDKADALLFVLIGKFSKDLTQGGASGSALQLDQYASSFAGSVVGSVLNNYLGNYIGSVDVQTEGSQTKFSVAGRYKNLRYTIGGTTDIFQDLSNANIRLEYSLIDRFLIRLERKEAITEQTTYSNEKINELGLMYRFEF